MRNIVSPLSGFASPFGQLRGSTSPSSDTPTTWDNTAENTLTANYVRTAPFASVSYDTTATEITINSYNDIFATYPQFTELGLVVDGVYQKVSPGASGAQSNVISLSAGTKRIEIRNGLQSRPSASIIGTFLVSIEANAELSRVTRSAVNNVLFYGDSIAVGANATSATGEGHPMLVRDAASVLVGVEGFGFRSLWDDCVDSTARAAFVAKIVTWNPATLWIGIGHNDYFLDRWNSTNFGTAYAALLDDLNTALPDLEVYAQSPIPRGADPDNSFGETLQAYRDEVSSAASGRAWVTFVDGTEMVGRRSLDDNVHPTTDGHFGMAEYINSTLGFVSPPVSSVIANRANTTVTGPDVRGMYIIEKTSGANGFNASADAGLTAFTGNFRMRMVILNEPFDRFAGVRTTDPTLDSNYTGIQYAFYDNAVWQGLPPVPNPSGAAGQYNGDLVLPAWIIRDGSTLTFGYGYDPDNITVLTTTTGVSGTLYFDSSLFQVGAKVSAAIYAT